MKSLLKIIGLFILIVAACMTAILGWILIINRHMNPKPKSKNYGDGLVRTWPAMPTDTGETIQPVLVEYDIVESRPLTGDTITSESEKQLVFILVINDENVGSFGFGVQSEQNAERLYKLIPRE